MRRYVDVTWFFSAQRSPFFIACFQQPEPFSEVLQGHSAEPTLYRLILPEPPSLPLVIRSLLDQLSHRVPEELLRRGQTKKRHYFGRLPQTYFRKSGLTRCLTSLPSRASTTLVLCL